MSFLVTRNYPQRNQVPVPIHLNLFRQQSSWADKPHVAFEDFPELREFIQRRCSEDLADPGHAIIAVLGLQRPEPLVRVGDHGSKLSSSETLAAKTDAPLAIKDGPTIFEFDACRDEQLQGN